MEVTAVSRTDMYGAKLTVELTGDEILTLLGALLCYPRYRGDHKEALVLHRQFTAALSRVMLEKVTPQPD